MLKLIEHINLYILTYRTYITKRKYRTQEGYVNNVVYNWVDNQMPKI